MVRHVLGMHQRQIEESAQILRNLQIETVHYGTVGDGPCLLIGGECFGTATKHVARKLIEQDN